MESWTEMMLKNQARNREKSAEALKRREKRKKRLPPAPKQKLPNRVLRARAKAAQQ